MPTSSPEAVPVRDVLRREEAEARRARVSRARYDLDIDLGPVATGYSGVADIRFELAAGALPLFLDFTGQVTGLWVEGHEREVVHEGHRLHLPDAGGAPGMHVRVAYRNRYDTSGDGLHHFQDPEDGSDYLYSNLQPFAAHRLFPCFDQPDIKGIYELTVTAPADWRVVLSEPAAVGAVEDGRRRHRFARTRPYSTYLVPLVAGPFELVEAAHRDIALGLYARRSMRAELERHAPELWEVTGQGLDFYADLFGRPFPFTKHDQLFVPEFNAGAMENVGAVTFHDTFLFRDPPTYAQRLERAEVVLHELAHSWFGDLVTSRWWDDLWLNESFATYVSYLCLAEATRFDDAWQVFNGALRPAAYRQDQLRTTHPIAADVADTDEAVGNFDAITYEKGAAVLKQLVATIGRDAFAAGLRRYVQRHAWDNATLADFLAALGEVHERDLGAWAEAWLRTPGVNTISARWSSVEGALLDLELRQSAPPEHPHLRPHALVLALVSDGEGSAGARVEALPAAIEGPRGPVPEARGRPAPALVFPNLGDHDYALASLDEASLAFVRERLPSVREPLLRQQLWTTLWEMVRDARLPSLEHLAIVRRFGPLETDAAMLETVLAHAQRGIAAFVPEVDWATETGALVELACRELRCGPDSDRRIIWARTAIGAAASALDLEPLLALLDGEWRVDGFALDQEMRWGLAVKSVAHGLPDADARLALEASRDPSDRGRRAVIRAQAARPETAAKAEAWRRIHAEGYGSDYLTRAAMGGFLWRHQRDLLAPYGDAFFDEVRAVNARHDHAWVRAYVRLLVPDRWAEPRVLERLARTTASLGAEEGLLRRQLDEVADDLERAIRVRAVARQALLPG